MQDRSPIHRRKGKFNLFDVFVILIIVGVIAAGTMFLTNRNLVETDTATKNIEYQVLIESLDPDIANSALVNDPVKDGISGNHLGIITAVRVDPYYTYVKNQKDKTMNYVTLPGKFNVTLTIQSKADMRDNTLFVDDRKIKISDESMILRSKHFAGSGICVAIKILDQ